ncbi:hypothetical protein DFH06DRAFT_1330426 [Mycena polygramma]|nr:hypothetical protein DFH06DRAFT_1330426 [Mycena polygramma]
MDPDFFSMLHAAPAFILYGLDLQETQRTLMIDAQANLDHPSLDGLKDIEIHDRREELRGRIEVFRSMQEVYMPDAYRLLSPRDRVDWNSIQYRDPERVPLFMPSEIRNLDQRHRSCAPGLPWLELCLRGAEARDATKMIERLSICHQLAQ